MLDTAASGFSTKFVITKIHQVALMAAWGMDTGHEANLPAHELMNGVHYRRCGDQGSVCDGSVRRWRQSACYSDN